VDEAGPHAEWPESVVSLVLRRECSVEATPKQRDRRLCVCSLMVIAHGGGVHVAT
jgi:hypothetical protein